MRDKEVGLVVLFFPFLIAIGVWVYYAMKEWGWKSVSKGMGLTCVIIIWYILACIFLTKGY